MNAQTVTITVNGSTIGKTVLLAPRDPNGTHHRGSVDGRRFHYMLASRATAEQELEKALNSVAAWKALLESDQMGPL